MKSIQKFIKNGSKVIKVLNELKEKRKQRLAELMKLREATKEDDGSGAEEKDTSGSE